MVYPLSSMGNHVSEVPNQQVGRTTHFDTRGNVAFFGMLGYELDPDKLDDTERDKIRSQIELYKKHRTLIRTGLFYRMMSPFEGNFTSLIVVSKDKREAVAACYRVLGSPNSDEILFKLQGLNPETRYRIDGRGDQCYFGDELMYAGLRIAQDEWTTRGDFASILWRLSLGE